MYASGRWHTIGHRITYCCYDSSAALLESLVHLRGKLALVPKRLKYLMIEVPGDIKLERIDDSKLPPRWRNELRVTRALGDGWLESKRSPALEVPSVLSPASRNLLLNPLHPAAASIRAVETIDHPVDPRLVRRRAQRPTRRR